MQLWVVCSRIFLRALYSFFSELWCFYCLSVWISFVSRNTQCYVSSLLLLILVNPAENGYVDIMAEGGEKEEGKHTQVRIVSTKVK